MDVGTYLLHRLIGYFHRGCVLYDTSFTLHTPAPTYYHTLPTHTRPAASISAPPCLGGLPRLLFLNHARWAAPSALPQHSMNLHFLIEGMRSPPSTLGPTGIVGRLCRVGERFWRDYSKNESSMDDACHGHLLVPEVENVYNVY